MIYSDITITNSISSGHIAVAPFNPAQLNPASYDLSLGSTIRTINPHYTEPLDLADIRPYTIINDYGDSYTMQSGEFLLGCTQESITIPDTVVARVEGKSSLARVGLAIHVTGGFIDPGFSGQITLEIVNMLRRPIILYPGMRIAQIAFQDVDNRPAASYSITGNYQGQRGPTESKYKLSHT